MALQSFTKQPADVLDYDVQADDWLPADDEIESGTHTVTGPDAAMTVQAMNIFPRFAKVWLTGGSNGARYKVTVVLVTANGRTKEVDFLIIVRDE